MSDDPTSTSLAVWRRRGRAEGYMAIYGEGPTVQALAHRTFQPDNEADMSKTHDYTAQIVWTGDRGEGTKSYKGYDRTWRIRTPDKLPIDCSNDPLLGGDPAKPNPEDLLLASLAGCHMLWYLHLASEAEIVVWAYEDAPLAVGEIGPRGEGRFTRAVLRPKITVARGSDLKRADALHDDVHRYCFIARSVNFPIAYESKYLEI